MLTVYIKRPTFSMKILNPIFFQRSAAQIQQKLLTSKSSRLWTLAVIRVFAWAKIRALKLLFLRKNVSNTTLLHIFFIFTLNSWSFFIFAMPNGSKHFLCQAMWYKLYIHKPKSKFVFGCFFHYFRVTVRTRFPAISQNRHFWKWMHFWKQDI